MASASSAPPLAVVPDDSLESIHAFVASCVPEFATTRPADVEISALSGGCTNVMYKVTIKASGFAVVFRRFGADIGTLSRHHELYWLQQFLKTYGRGEGVLVFEFLSGHRPLTSSDLPILADQLAVALAKFHEHGAEAEAGISPPQGLLMDDIFSNWPQLCSRAIEGLSDERRSLLAERWGDFAQPSYFSKLTADVQETVKALAPRLPVAPCHNDLNASNVMARLGTAAADSSTPSFRFIDFEYMRPNYVYFDIANHFCEYMGLGVDLSWYPAKPVRQRFIAKYLEAAAAGGRGAVPASEDEEMAIVEYMATCSHLMWGLWSILQFAASTIDFDFLEYGLKRMQGAKAWHAAAGAELRVLGLL